MYTPPYSPLPQKEVQLADIVLPGRLHQILIYQVPCSYASKSLIGHRAIVPLGQTLATGIIVHIHNNLPSYKVRALLALPDSMPIFDKRQMDFLHWMAGYYLCDLAEVIQVTLGATQPFLSITIRLAATYNPALSYDAPSKKLLDALHKYDGLTYKQAKEVLGKQVASIEVLSFLLDQKAITLAVPLTSYLPKVKHLSLHIQYSYPDEHAKLKKLLGNKPKQEAVLTAYLEHIQSARLVQQAWVAKKTLLQKAISPHSLKTLLKKNIFVEHEKTTLPFSLPPAYVPNHADDENEALASIHKQWKSQKVVLLQGTSSAHLTRLTLQITAQALSKGQVLYLLPTIKQIMLLSSHLKKLFGEDIGIYHAECTKFEKIVIWHAVQKGQLNFILGTRSALFLPFKALKHIIVAEEQDVAYKQTLKNPRYHARDLAIVLARQHDAHVLLSSTTPSLMSYHNAVNKRYGLVVFDAPQHTSPIRLAPLPRKKAPFTTGHQLAPSLVRLLKEQLNTQKQIIILHSRKGYAAYTLCKACHWLPTCANCERNLIYHQATHKLHCHHCNYTSPPPSHCPKCTSPALQHHSMGTQQAEELLQFYLPHASMQRLDGDVVYSNKNYLKVLDKFRAQKIDVLIATPGLIPLLPIGTPCLVAVLDIENWLNKPAFNAYEKTYQALAKLSDSTVATSLLLQISFNPNPKLQILIKELLQKNYRAVYKQSLSERKAYGYPPYVRLVKVSLLHPHAERLMQAADHFFKAYQVHLGLPMLGPTPYRQNVAKRQCSTEIWLKLPRNSLLDKTKKQIVALSNKLLENPAFQKVHIVFDVDPL